MIPQAPWTGVGAIQGELSSLKQEIDRKANSYEIHDINRKMDSLERECRNIRSEIDGILTKLQELETRHLTLEESNADGTKTSLPQ